MNIQVSVIIWTVICFLALYLILKYLLFTPLLTLMDARQKKIADRERARAAAEQALADEYRQAVKAQQARDLEARKKAAAEAEEVRLEGKRLLADAKKERMAAVADYRAEMEAAYTEELHSMEPRIEEAASVFLARLFADRQ